jgi:hypothetical protein
MAETLIVAIIVAILSFVKHIVIINKVFESGDNSSDLFLLGLTVCKTTQSLGP